MKRVGSTLIEVCKTHHNLDIRPEKYLGSQESYKEVKQYLMVLNQLTSAKSHTINKKTKRIKFPKL